MYRILVAGLFVMSSLGVAQTAKSGAAPKAYLQCAGCHGAKGQGGMGGPKLTGLTKKKALAKGGAPTEANLTRVIQKGVGVMPAMPHIEGENLKAILAYLKTL